MFVLALGELDFSHTTLTGIGGKGALIEPVLGVRDQAELNISFYYPDLSKGDVPLLNIALYF